MDFAWTDEQQKLRESIVEFAQTHLSAPSPRLETDSSFPMEAWKKCAELGIHGLLIPRQYGGLEADALTTIYGLEGLGYGCQDNGLIFSINAHMWSCEMPILTFGTEAQKERLLPKLCRGELIGGNAMTEPGSGSDAFSLATTAQRKGDHYLLNGSKTFVTNGPIADVLVVYATVDRSRGPRGITTFLVEKGFSGFSAGRQMEKMGLRTSPLGQVSLMDCEVPLENCLGAEGAGVGIFTHSMEWERSCILASAVGEMQRQLEACIRYARERKQFGQPIGKFQLVATKIVDMKVRLETARSLIYRVGWLKSKGRLALMEAAMAKLYISECWVQSCLDAIQIHGGYGYMTDLGLERELRDALGSRLYSGTSEIQRLVIAQLLGL